MKFLQKPVADNTMMLSAKRNRSHVCDNPAKHDAHDSCPGRQRAAKIVRPIDPAIQAELVRARYWRAANKQILGLFDGEERLGYDLDRYEEPPFQQKEKWASFFTVVKRVNDIIRDYASQNLLPLTLRQIHYQFVVRHKDYLNTKESYTHTCEDIGVARMGGLVPWNAIHDPTRDVHSFLLWNNPKERLEFAADVYRIDRWEAQDYSPIVLIEKDAAIGTITNVCDEYDVPYLSCRGYGSLSALHDKVGGHCRKAIKDGKTPVVIHLSDHDATGADMERNLNRRLSLVADEAIDVRHIALTLSQIDEYQLPSDPVKSTDPRAGKYLEMLSEKGLKEGAWEMDALSPTVLHDLIEQEINTVRDVNHWNQLDDQQARDRESLKQIAERWDDVQSFLCSSKDGEEV